MESITRDHIMCYFVKEKLFSNKQFGFIKGQSTVTQLLTILDEWTKYLEKGRQIDVIHTDFEKAFDRVPHRQLISKMYSYGINIQVIKWVEAFSKDRRQWVKINGKLSKWQFIKSGTPQGSILGPILFIIFINNIANRCSNGSEIYLYAYDAKIFRHISTETDCQMLHFTLFIAINNVKTWSSEWL